ncbi:hypothetical protein FRB94_000047 [Tulasnella sp. JGI-2019a]|nr:hypothetical protein FRB94_000047 [Tulasnella sp. JGI-2019a]KAG9015734.1 hypothetical protein FRB93_012298 [Tulasnella sp. JGI-2019a]
MADDTNATAAPAAAGTQQANPGAGGGNRGRRNNAGGGGRKPAAAAGDATAPAPATNGGQAAPSGNNAQRGSSTRRRGGGGGTRSSVNTNASAASEDGISRPSSTDGNKSSGSARRGNRRASGSRGGAAAGRGGGRNSASNSPSVGGKAGLPTPPLPAASTSPAAASPGLSSLQRVITDLKQASSATAAPPAATTGPSGAAQQAPTAPVAAPSPVITSNLAVDAPVFQPGAGVYPPPAAAKDVPRPRKTPVSVTGHIAGQNYSNQSFSSPLTTFSPNLGVMQEDAAEEGEDEDVIINHASPTLQQGGPGRNIAQSTMGSFTAPRFVHQAPPTMQQQPGGEPEPSNIGPTGRPQLAPNFMFGQRRTPLQAMAGAVPEDDLGYQFVQAQAQAQQQQALNTDAARINPHRRTPSEMTGVSPLMAEQLAIQNQIEVLQQQQQQLLQQQIATNSVMSSFSASPQLGRGNAGVGPGVHRRIQSQQVPMGMGFPNFQQPMGNFGGLGGGVGLGLSSNANGQGHGRRHSVNVINKAAEQGGATAGLYANGVNDGFEDGFAPPPGVGGHSRQASRADNWRMNPGQPGGMNAFGGDSGLAQAQAQLASLQQFRAAGGGHQKMQSFALPNMLPNMMAANMMGLTGYNLLQQQQQQMQQFQMQMQQTQGPQRKSLFAPYLPQASLPPLLAAGKLVVGILRVNKRNRSDAYVATEVLDSDIYICGSKDRNRALEGDIVAVELLDVDEVWGTKKEKEEKKRKKEENAAFDPRGASGRKNDKKKDDVEVEGQGMMLFEDEEVTDEIKPQFAGHVVAVVERMPGQLFSGTLGLLRPSSAATKEKQEAERRERGQEEEPKSMERPKIVWFKPTDKRVPLIAIPTEQAPPDFVNNSDAYADRLFVACIKRHPISSLHPFGTLVEELGPIGEVEVETSALLKDCNFPTEEFTDSVLKCVPPVPWTIPEREYEVRKDLRAERVFTIDPATAKDLDDALSIKRNEDGTFEVGVHIADVSHFVKPNTSLDRDARKRATTVYLVQRAVPMLPPVLCEELCSLTPHVERLAFSIIFTMTEDARVTNKWLGKTIIKSAAKLAYSNAQNAIEGKPLGAVDVSPEHEVSAIEEDIKALQSLASRLKARRVEVGVLRIDSVKLRFTLGDNGLPIDCTPEDKKEANSLVEEFMLLANISAAQQVANHLPEQAMLRRHPEPIERRLASFAERAALGGYKFDMSSPGAIQRSLNDIKNPDARMMLETLLKKSMYPAVYFCSGMLDIAKYHHYALGEPLYTHFTSPIRRYADILVHRQLESIVATGAENKFNMDRDAVAKIAQQCNIKKQNAKLAQEQSAHLFLCLLISDLTQRHGPVVRQAKVVGVLDAAFDVLVPEFGIEKRVHVDQMPIDNHVYDGHSHTLQIYWSKRDVISWLAENSDDEHLKKVKRNAEHHAKMEVASLSVHDEHALFDEDDDEDEVVLNRTSDQRKLDKTETSKQRLVSAAKVPPVFEGLRQSAAGQNIQDIRVLMNVPVIVTADLTKSPPVIKVYSVNPYAMRKD